MEINFLHFNGDNFGLEIYEMQVSCGLAIKWSLGTYQMEASRAKSGKD